MTGTTSKQMPALNQGRHLLVIPLTSAGARTRESGSQQTLEERPIPLKRDTEIFGGHLIAPIPLMLEVGSLGGEALRQALDDIGHKLVALLHGAAGLVHETRLDSRPALTKLLRGLG